MRACIRLSREIFQQKAFDEFRGEELKPGTYYCSDNLDFLLAKDSGLKMTPKCRNYRYYIFHYCVQNPIL